LNDSLRVKYDIAESTHGAASLVWSNLDGARNGFVQSSSRHFAAHILLTNHQSYSQGIAVYIGKPGKMELVFFGHTPLGGQLFEYLQDYVGRDVRMGISFEPKVFCAALYFSPSGVRTPVKYIDFEISVL
jgi:hypothetical protein